MKIPNRTFLISGASSGLGLSTSKLLLSLGAFVCILDIQPPPQSILDTHSQNVLYLSTDITVVEQIEDAVLKAVRWAQFTKAPLGGLINCAGVAIPSLIVSPKGEPHSVRRWEKTVAVNLNGPFHLTRLLAPHLIAVEADGEDGERGVVILVSSLIADQGQEGTAAYAATKGALNSMTLPLARDFSRYGIRVVTISPGAFASPMTGVMNEKIQRGLRERGVLYPKRFGKAEEFAESVRWVLECSYVNGEVVRVSGGVRLPARM